MTMHLADTADAFADRIGHLWVENANLDHEHLDAIREGRSTPGAPEPECDAVVSELRALERRLVTSKATSLKGVMVQLMLAAQYADFSGSWCEDKEAAQYIMKMEFLVCSAMEAIAEITGEPHCNWAEDGLYFQKQFRKNLTDKLAQF